MEKGRYAAGTEVPVERTKAEIERLLQRYGADSFLYGWAGDVAVIGFRLAERHVRIYVPLPSKADPAFRTSPTGRYRASQAAVQSAWEQAIRQRWRAVALVLKAKLEAVAAGISTIEREFLADTLLPDGRTVGEWAAPQLETMYRSGQMPPLLPMPNKTRELGEG
jgi:hypothetical protein